MRYALIVSLFLNIGCSVFGINNVEGPTYTVIKTNGNKQIRKYESYIIARTKVNGNMDKAGNKGFRILANYIFAKNRSGDKIQMTSPVTQKKTKEKIKMTSPVIQQKSQGNNSYYISFIMPKKYTLDSLPKTDDKKIEFARVPARYIASYRYSWFRTSDKNAKYAKVLRSWISNNTDFAIISDFMSAGYNPPWTIPFFRRNEVMFELEKR